MIIFMFLIVAIVAWASTVLPTGNSRSSDDYDYCEHCYLDNLIDDDNRMNDEMFQQFMFDQQKESILTSDVCIVVSNKLKQQLELNTAEPIDKYAVVSCAVDLNRFYNESYKNTQLQLEIRRDIQFRVLITRSKIKFTN